MLWSIKVLDMEGFCGKITTVICTIFNEILFYGLRRLLKVGNLCKGVYTEGYNFP